MIQGFVSGLILFSLSAFAADVKDVELIIQQHNANFLNSLSGDRSFLRGDADLTEDQVATVDRIDAELQSNAGDISDIAAYVADPKNQKAKTAAKKSCMEQTGSIEKDLAAISKTGTDDMKNSSYTAAVRRHIKGQEKYSAQKYSLYNICGQLLSGGKVSLPSTKEIDDAKFSAEVLRMPASKPKDE